MDCRDFERRFETFLAGELSAWERGACEAHLAACPACRELLELAAPAGLAGGAEASAGDLLGAVLAETSGSACGRAGELLAARLDEVAADPLDRELLDLHLAACAGCRSLARVLALLGDDLPAMAEVRPDRSFVDDVLAATLPAAVRWRRAFSRSWSRRWAAWLRRPRFAWEAAFVLTLVFLPVFASTAAPLASIPQAAREIARENPVPRLGGAIDRRVEGTVDALAGSEPVERAGRTLGAAHSWLDALGAQLAGWAGAAEDAAGTLRDRAASFLVEAAAEDDDPPRPDPSHPTTTRAADGSKEGTR
jgi:hypothetical protein